MVCEDESDECKSARSEYERCRANQKRAIDETEKYKDHRNVSGAVAGASLAGVIAIGLATGPPGWLVVLGYGLGAAAGIFGGGAVYDQTKVNEWRGKCHSARNCMIAARNNALEHCTTHECVPSDDIPNCP